MTRLTPLAANDVPDATRAMYEQVLASPRTRGAGRAILVRENGSLAGPFDAWLRTPAIGQHLETLGMSLRTDSCLAASVREVVVLTVAAAWQVDFEFQVHAMVALRNGVDESTIRMLAKGEPITAEHEDWRIANQLTRELLERRSITDETWQLATRILGEAGTIEIITLAGFYQLVSGILISVQPPEPDVDIPAPTLNAGETRHAN